MISCALSHRWVSTYRYSCCWHLCPSRVRWHGLYHPSLGLPSPALPPTAILNPPSPLHQSAWTRVCLCVCLCAVGPSCVYSVCVFKPCPDQPHSCLPVACVHSRGHGMEQASFSAGCSVSKHGHRGLGSSAAHMWKWKAYADVIMW